MKRILWVLLMSSMMQLYPVYALGAEPASLDINTEILNNENFNNENSDTEILNIENLNIDNSNIENSNNENLNIDNSNNESLNTENSNIENLNTENSNNESLNIENLNTETLNNEVVIPAFSAEVVLLPDGFHLLGTVDSLPANTAKVRPYYSLNGTDFMLVNDSELLDWNLLWLETEDEDELEKLHTQTCCVINMEPLQSYMNGDLEGFYSKLEITLDNGLSYFTEANYITRGEPQNLPADSTVNARYDKTMSVKPTWTSPFSGRYNITVTSDMTADEIYELLPKTVPVEVQLEIPKYSLGPNKETVIGAVNASVVWKQFDEQDLVAGESIKINDAAMEVVVSAGTQLSTQKGIYILPEDVSLNQFVTLPDGTNKFFALDDIELVINVLGEDSQYASLDGGYRENTMQLLDLDVHFPYKPTGATSIKVYSYAEGKTQWTEIFDLLKVQSVEAHPNSETYSPVTIFTTDEGLYAKYLEDNSKTFIIGLAITGGILDGKEIILPWPESYAPSFKIPDIIGSGGGEVNTGKPDDGNSNAGGQRPNLPSGSGSNSNNDDDDDDKNNDDKNDNDDKKDEVTKPEENNFLETWENPYTDIKDNHYFYEGVAFVQNEGLMVGVSENAFAPYEKTTRGMLTTVLARVANVKTDGGDAWYSVGMDWAVAQNISDGSNPQSSLNREQMITMLWRAAGNPNSLNSLTEFNDSDEISDYAKIAMAWACNENILTGTANRNICPKTTVNRGEFATILMRYIEKQA